MSFISIIAQESFLTVMSEGRVSCDGKPTGEENFKKFVRVSPHFIVTFGGAREFALKFLEETGLLYENDGDFKSLADNVQKRLLSSPYNEYKIAIGLGGINSSGQIEFFSMNTQVAKRVHFLPNGDKIQFTFFHLDGYSMDLQKELIRLLGKTGFRTPAQTLQAQKLLNDSFAKINPSMNRKTFQAVISLEQSVNRR